MLPSPSSDAPEQPPSPWVVFVARPLVLVVGSVATMWVLMQWAVSGTPLEQNGPVRALVDTLTLRPFHSVDESIGPDPVGAAATSFELMVVGTALALAVGVVVGLVARSHPVLDAMVGFVTPGFAALVSPAVTVALVYWLIVRFEWIPFRWEFWGDDAGDHLKSLVIPAVVVALVVAPAVVAFVRDAAGSGPAPWGYGAVVPLLAERSAAGRRWRVGYPLGSVVVALTVVEVVLNIPGLFGLTWRTLQVLGDQSIVVATAGALALVAAGGTLAIDGLQVGLRSMRSGLPSLPRSVPRPLAVAGAAAGGAGVVVLVLLAGLGWVTDDPEPLAGDRLVGLLSDGHLLGTDDLGRDLLSVVVHGAGTTLVASVVPALLATAVGVGLALVGRAVAPLDEPVVGLPVEALTWMAPLVLVAYAVGEGAGSLTAPVLLALMTVLLVPTATRACRRVLDGGGAEMVLAACGVAASLATQALVVTMTAGLLGLERPSGTSSWGTGLGQSLQSLAVTPRVGAVFGWAMVLTALAFHLLGASLLALARRPSDSSPPVPPPPPATPF